MQTEATTWTAPAGAVEHWCDACGTMIVGLPAVKKGTIENYTEFCTYACFERWRAERDMDERIRRTFGERFLASPVMRKAARDAIVYGTEGD